MNVPIEIPLLGPAMEYIVEFGHLKLMKDNCTNDFCPEPSKSVLTTRPIPTLGLFHVNTQDLRNDILSDWYLESDRNSDIPQESNVSNATINTDLQSDGTSKPNENEPSNGLDNTTNMKTFHITDPLKVFKFKNENINNWISLELDNSTKDDESDYVFGNRATVVISKGNRDSLESQQYFNVSKVNTDVTALIHLKSDIHKPVKCHSTPNSLRKREDIKVPVNSYVEYPSEVLQKTTNFESEDLYLESDRNSDIPQESNVSNATINTDLQSDGTSKPNENEPSNGLDNTTNMKTFHITDPLKVFKFKNENINNWISLELDNSTKDDESDYVFGNRATVVISKGNRDSLESQQYFNVSKVNTDVTALIHLKSDIHKPVKCHSTPNSLRKREDIKVPVNSYVEYPSEVLQKTTNFESEGKL
ncbi:jg17324 [Pararge aegeria aegeria]|uniref:Jg17324 protein n=1 Tax=Pararge aegeria aegeria TaxID=348720 RepID=A0A8S4SHU8_9NEOP|nr:jg17324 [Pararge aegeria aegeria]